MKKIILIMALALISVVSFAQNSYKLEGDVYSSVKTTRTSEPEKTPYTWKDNKGNSYPIYISGSGSCYVIKTSAKTGKEYKNYLGPEISSDICRKLGREYKGKATKSK